MTKARLTMVGGLVLFGAGFPAMFDLSRYWWWSASYVAGFAMLVLGRRRHDLL